jgi:hypothetical protein
MSETASGGGGEVVRGDGNAPGQSSGEPMPAVTTTERKSLSDFQRDMRAKNESPARAPAPQTAKTRIGSFSEALEKRQQAPVMPNEQRRQGEEQSRDPSTQEPPEVPQLAEPNPDAQAIELDDSKQGEVISAEQSAAEFDDKSALEKFRQWEQDDMFPSEMESKLHEVKVNGITRYVPTTELRQGYMRGGDYRRQFAELQGQQQLTARERQATQDHFNAIRDPDQMLEIYERNGYGETLMKVADKLHERRARNNQIIEGAGIAAMRSLGLRTADWNHKDVQAAMQDAQSRLQRAHEADIQRRQLDFEKRQTQQTREQTISQQQTQQRMQQYDNQLNQLRPSAFKAYGLANTEGNRQGLIRHLSNVLKTPEYQFKGELTRSQIMAAAADLKQEQEEARERERGLDRPTQGRVGQGQPLPPNRMGTGGGAPLGNLGGQKQARLSDLEAMVRKGRLQ